MQNAIANLDLVLNYLGDNVSYKRFEEIQKGIIDKEVDETTLLLVLEKLINDGYVLKEVTAMGNAMIGNYSMTYYKISFNGKVFSEEGGYKKQQEIISQQLKLQEQETANLASERKHQEALTEALKRYQFWIVLATVVAGIYYLVELLKYFHILPSRF